jgi:hypothetical protein
LDAAQVRSGRRAKAGVLTYVKVDADRFNKANLIADDRVYGSARRALNKPSSSKVSPPVSLRTPIFYLAVTELSSAFSVASTSFYVRNPDIPSLSWWDAMER